MVCIVCVGDGNLFFVLFFAHPSGILRPYTYIQKTHFESIILRSMIFEVEFKMFFFILSLQHARQTTCDHGTKWEVQQYSSTKY